MALPAHIVDNVTPIGATVINPLIDEQTDWTVDKNGGAHNLSNVATLTFTTLGGHVAGNSKELTGLAKLSATTVSGGLESTNTRTFIKGNDGTHHWFSTGGSVGEPNNLIWGISVDPANGRVTGVKVLVDGVYRIEGTQQTVKVVIPTSSAGLPSASLWRDPAATTKTAGASYTANEQAMLNEIKAYLASVVKQVP